jgi:hypothetical protein
MLRPQPFRKHFFSAAEGLGVLREFPPHHARPRTLQGETTSGPQGRDHVLGNTMSTTERWRPSIETSNACALAPLTALPQPSVRKATAFGHAHFARTLRALRHQPLRWLCSPPRSASARRSGQGRLSYPLRCTESPPPLPLVSLSRVILHGGASPAPPRRFRDPVCH